MQWQKRHQPRLIVPAVAVLLLAVGVLVGRQVAFGSPTPHPVEQLESRQLIPELDSVGAPSSQRGMAVRAELWRRRKDIPREQLVSSIVDKSRPSELRELSIDLLAGPPEEAKVTDDVRALMQDSRLTPSLKARMIASYEFDRRDAALLGSIAKGGDDIAAFHALKKLGAADPATAKTIAVGAIKALGTSSNLQLSAAYKALVRSGVLAEDRETRRLLLTHLRSVLAETAPNQELVDSASFALADMRSLDSLRVLLESKSVDGVLRSGAVHENALVIIEALEHEPDEATVELAVMAMEVRPIRDVAEPLLSAREGVRSAALRKRLDACLIEITKNGSSITPAWAED